MDKRLLEYYKRCKENNIPAIDLQAITFIGDYINNNNNFSSLLEIGSATGFSALFFTVYCNLSVTTLEIDKDRFSQLLENYKSFEEAKEIEALNVDAKLFDNQYLGKFDIIFIDAAKGQYKFFFEKYVTNLSETGIIVVDNLVFHNLINEIDKIRTRRLRSLIKKIIEFRVWLTELEGFNVSFHDEIGDGIAIIKRSNNA